MSQVKRAAWVEGITQSKRILRDLTEIVTTANRDENGVVASENWELVYPRPFNEYPIVRGRLIRDVSSPRQFRPVIERREIILLTDTTPVKLQYKDVFEQTISVYNEDKTIKYEKDVDYSYDATQNTISRIEAGSINSTQKLIIEYGTKVNRILESVPVKIEKELTQSNPEREIDPALYTIDYVNKRVKLTTDVTADADYLMLEFTEVKTIYEREEHTGKNKMILEKDLLDPNGLTYKLPAGSGAIAEHPEDKREVAYAATGVIGSGNGGAIQYEFDPVNHTITFLTGEPTLNAKQKLILKAVQAIDAASNWGPPDEYELYLNLDPGAPPHQYKIKNAVYQFNPYMPHAVYIVTESVKPTLYKHLTSLHAGFEDLEEDKYMIDYENPKITVLEDIPNELFITFTARDEYNLDVGLNKIKDRIVLKTTTVPEQYFPPVIGKDYGAVDTAESLTMYVEIQKPERLVNPETGLTRYVDHLGRQHETQKNNHYIQIRMFDKWDDENQKPQDTVFDKDGTIIKEGAYISDWVKYSWFKDWKEYMIDELDDDPGTANVNDGILFKEVITEGMNEEFPIQFWISTNNNRIAMVLMGDPTLDQDNFLTSFAYLGRIHPFYSKECVVKRDENGVIMLDGEGNPILEEKRTYFQNDVSGNFALTAGSSTIPAAVGAPPKGRPVIDSVEPAVDDKGNPIVGDLYDYTVFSYVVTYLTEVGESMPTTVDSGRLIVPNGFISGDPANSTKPEIGLSIKIRFRLPEEATGYRIYRFHDAGKNTFGTEANNYSNYKLVTQVNKLDRSRTIEYIDTGVVLPMQQGIYDPTNNVTNYVLVNNTLNPYYAKFISAVPSARSFEAVTRDAFTGAILDVKFSTKWGRDTATGVNDIMMFQTRSGLKYQRHSAAFITTEEFMRKEKSGQSRWTGKFHLSPIYVEHSYDKQRGWLDGVMAVDDAGIEHLDELIVDKDTPNEEVYKFFRVNAPYSFFNNSPNYSYGLAIIKSSLRWK